MATCERRVYLRAKYGDRETRAQRQAKDRGTMLHDLAYQQSRPDGPARDKRCFVATCVYGQDAWETELLREFRDRRLGSWAGGRLLTRVYYRVSPGVVGVLEKWPGLKTPVRKGLDWVVALVKRKGG